MLHRLLTAFNNVDVLTHILLLPIYFSICEMLIIDGETYRLTKLIALVSALHDTQLLERWNEIRRMYIANMLNHDLLHTLVQETIAKFTADAKLACSDGRLLNY